jgi:hypothetical protein
MTVVTEPAAPRGGHRTKTGFPLRDPLCAPDARGQSVRDKARDATRKACAIRRATRRVKRARTSLGGPHPPRHPPNIIYSPPPLRYYFSLFTEYLGPKKLGLKKLKNQNSYSPIPLIVFFTITPMDKGQN